MQPGRSPFDSKKSSESSADRHMLVSMTEAAFRKIALSLPDTAEGVHFKVADFRVGGKIFATLAYKREGCGVLLLTPEQQAGMIVDAPEIFFLVSNEWGDRGATLVRLTRGAW